MLQSSPQGVFKLSSASTPPDLLSSLSQVLYLDMALEAPTDDVPSTAEQINATLGALPKLSILSLGA